MTTAVRFRPIGYFKAPFPWTLLAPHDPHPQLEPLDSRLFPANNFLSGGLLLLQFLDRLGARASSVNHTLISTPIIKRLCMRKHHKTNAVPDSQLERIPGSKEGDRRIVRFSWVYLVYQPDTAVTLLIERYDLRKLIFNLKQTDRQV